MRSENGCYSTRPTQIYCVADAHGACCRCARNLSWPS